MLNRQGDTVSAQISAMGPITFQGSGSSFERGEPFNIKNDGEGPTFLEVNLWGMSPGIRYNPLRDGLEPRDRKTS